MVNRQEILKRITKDEDKLLVSKVLDKAVKAENAGTVLHTDFLDPYQKNMIEKALERNIHIHYTFQGGYYGAERVLAVFCPDFILCEDLAPADYGLKLLEIHLHGRESLSHRDYLGALMGLGMKREKIGDIVVREDACTVVVLEEIADYIRYNLEKVGNVKVSVEVKEVDAMEVDQPKVKEIRATVSSLRLDSVASVGYGISRSKMADFIKGEKVNLNWETCSSLTKQVKEGDVLSVRGKGRVVLEKVAGTTKKDRLHIVLKKYI